MLTTELLIRRHYASDVADAHDSNKHKLTGLVRKVQTRLRGKHPAEAVAS